MKNKTVIFTDQNLNRIQIIVPENYDPNKPIIHVVDTNVLPHGANLLDVFPLSGNINRVYYTYYKIEHLKPENKEVIKLAPLKCTQNNKKEEDMYNTAIVSNTPAVSIEQQQKKYLLDRAERISYKKMEELPALFGMRDDPSPRTRKELAERIAAGKFVIEGLDEKPEKDVRFYDLCELIRWRDPSKKEDAEGYEKARTALKDAHTALKDIIMVKDAETALTALQEFEKRSFA